MKKDKLEGKIEMIDYILEMYCDKDINPQIKQQLKNLKFGFQVKIEKLKK